MKRKAIAAVAVVLVAAGLASHAADASGSRALAARGSFSLGCPIGSGAAACSRTSMKVISGESDASPCVFSAASLATGGGQEGRCRVDGGSGKSGSLSVELAAGSCYRFRIAKLNTPASAVFTDPTGVQWTMSYLLIIAASYTHDGVTGEDVWLVDPVSRVTLRNSQTGRSAMLELAGSVRSTSNCIRGIGPASFAFDITGVGVTIG